MRHIKEAAENKEEVEFVIKFKEIDVTKNGTPFFKVGMKCKDTNGEELDGWLTHSHWGSVKAGYFIELFLSSLAYQTSLSYEAEEWVYEEDKIMGNTGKCSLTLNDAGYATVHKWHPISRVQVTTEAKDYDDDLPF